jgi:lipid II:glycine glycyltransferase (peptidoglycan interpeptide bridge formation enzyme)
MNIEIISPFDYPGWDVLMQENENSSFFHTSAWAAVLSKTYNYKPLYFSIFENNKLATLIPIMEIKSFITGKRGVSLPFTDECPQISDGEEHHKAVLEALIQYGKQAQWRYFELRNGIHYLSNQPFFSSFITHSIDLSRGQKIIFKNFRNSNKRNIKKAQKKGVIAKVCSSMDSVESFYRLHCRTRKFHGLPTQPWRFFKYIYEHVIKSKRGLVVLASYQGRIISGAVYFHFGNQAIYKYGASDRAYLHLRPNNLVMWTAMIWYIQNSFKNLSFGRTKLQNDGLLQFKRGWGAGENLIHYYKYDLQNDCFIEKKANIKSSYKFFKIMPLPILKVTGNLIYRHVG